jgi:hypothetical protein
MCLRRFSVLARATSLDTSRSLDRLRDNPSAICIAVVHMLVKPPTQNSLHSPFTIAKEFAVSVPSHGTNDDAVKMKEAPALIGADAGGQQFGIH